jgi:CheY-like chemotaxis protein
LVRNRFRGIGGGHIVDGGTLDRAMHITDTTPLGVKHLNPQLPLVLMVDDDPGDVHLLREALREGDVHVRLLAASDATQAMGALRLAPQQGAPRLIILDLGLPGIRGDRLLSAFGANTPWAAVPKVVLTGSVRPVDREESIALGAAAYFVKPPAFQGYLELVGELRKYL